MNQPQFMQRGCPRGIITFGGEHTPINELRLINMCPSPFLPAKSFLSTPGSGAMARFGVHGHFPGPCMKFHGHLYSAECASLPPLWLRGDAGLPSLRFRTSGKQPQPKPTLIPRRLSYDSYGAHHIRKTKHPEPTPNIRAGSQNQTSRRFSG